MSKFEVKEKIDELIYRVFNVFSDAILFLGRKNKNLIKDNSRFKDVHYGDRCFIVGTGPSINSLSDSFISKWRMRLFLG